MCFANQNALSVYVGEISTTIVVPEIKEAVLSMVKVSSVGSSNVLIKR